MCSADAKPVKYFAAMALIGDGVMALVQPSYYARVWKKGPKAWRVSMEWLAERPAVTRAIGAAEIVGGVLWMLHECGEPSSRRRRGLGAVGREDAGEKPDLALQSGL